MYRHGSKIFIFLLGLSAGMVLSTKLTSLFSEENITKLYNAHVSNFEKDKKGFSKIDCDIHVKISKILKKEPIGCEVSKSSRSEY